MKSKKLISFLCAAALTVSSFTGLTISASAEVGDTLLAKQTFEETDWGVAARTNRFTVTYEALADKPAGVEGTKSLAVDSVEGNDGASKVSLPTVTASSTGAYAIEFDTRLVSGDYKTDQTQDATTKAWSKNERTLGTGNEEQYRYAYGFGNETADGDGVVKAYSDMFGIEVRGDSVYLRSGVGNVVDTGFDVPITGAWFHVAVTADTASAKYKATITPYNEEGAKDDAKAVTKYSIDFPKQTATTTAATTLTSMYLQSIRSSDGNKGLMTDVAIDNFAITEAKKIEARDITINYVDASNNVIKTETDKAEEGVAYTVSDSKKVSFVADDGTHYYKYTDTGSTTTISSVAESGNVITLKFTTENLVDVTYNAVKPNGTVIKQLYTTKAIPATKVTYFNNIYIKEGNDYYKAKDTSNYKQEVTVGDSATTANVVYKLADNVKYYKEAEEFTKDDGTLNEALQNTATFSGGIANRGPALSDGKNEGFETDTVPAAGDYDFTFVAHASKRGEFVAIVSEDGIATNITDNYPDLTEGTDTKYFNSGTFTLPVTLAAGDKLRVYARTDGNNTWGSKAMNRIDYLLLTQGEATSVEPTVTLDYTKSNKTATISVTNMDEVGDDVPVTLIHSSYNSDGSLKDVKVYPKTVAIASLDGTTSSVTQVLSEAVAKGDKLMVWDSLNGLKPLLQPAHEITETEADDDIPTTYTLTVTADNTTDFAVSYDGSNIADLTQATTIEGSKEIVVSAIDNDKKVTGVTAEGAVFAADGDKFKATTTADTNVVIKTVTVAAKEVTPTTYTISGTVNSTVTKVTVTNGDITVDATPENDEYSVTVPAGTYTITPTVDTDLYEVTPANYTNVEVTDANITDKDFTTLKKYPANAKPSITAEGGAVKVGAALSADLTALSLGDAAQTATVTWYFKGESDDDFAAVPANDSKISEGKFTPDAEGTVKVKVEATGYVAGGVESDPTTVGPDVHYVNVVITATGIASATLTNAADANKTYPASAGTGANEGKLVAAVPVNATYNVTATAAQNYAAPITYTGTTKSGDDEQIAVAENATEDVALTIAATATYALASDNGTFYSDEDAQTSITRAKATDTVYFVPTAAAAHKKITEVASEKVTTINAPAQDKTTYSFTMPAEDVTVTVTYDDIKSTVSYTAATDDNTLELTSTDTDAAKIEATGTAVKAGSTVTVTATPTEGYKVTSITIGGVTYDGTTDKEFTSGNGTGVTTKTFDIADNSAAEIAVSAAFAKVDYTITVPEYTEAPIHTITMAEAFTSKKANKGDQVQFTVTPAANYQIATVKVTYGDDSEITVDGTDANKLTATAGADNTTYTFTMPAADVSIEATFEDFTLTREIPEGYTLIKEWDTTATKSGNRTVWQPTAGNQDFTNQNPATDIVIFETDFYIANDENINFTFGASKGTGFGGQTSTLMLTGADGKIGIKGQNGGTTYNGYSYTTGSDETLSTATWYRMTVTTVPTGTGYSEKVEIYAVDTDTLAVGDKKVEGTLTWRTGTDEYKVQYNRINIGVTGTPLLDNTYIYKPTEYNATVTVTDGTNAIKGVSVTLDNLAKSSDTTDESGIASFTLPAGSYNITVAKDFYSAPAETQTLTVTSDGANNIDIAMTAIPSSQVTFAATDAATKTASITDFTVVVKKGTAVVAPNEEGGKVYTLEQGGSYTYSMTLSGDAANSYDGVTDAALTVGTNTSETVTAELAVKTYAVTVSNVPRYARIYISSDEGSTYTAQPVAWTGADGQIIETGDGSTAYNKDGNLEKATNVVVSGQASGSTVYYKISKSGYTDLTGSVTLNGADANIDASSLAPSTGGVLYFEDIDYIAALKTNGIKVLDGAYYRYKNASTQYGINVQDKNAVATLYTDYLKDNTDATHYEFSYDVLWNTSSKAKSSSVYSFKDLNGKTLATMELHSTTQWNTDYIKVTIGDTEQTIGTEGGTALTLGTVKLDVNQSSGAVSLTVAGETVSGTVTGAGMIATWGVGYTNHIYTAKNFTIKKVN